MRLDRICQAKLAAGMLAAVLISAPAHALVMTTVIPGAAAGTELSGGDSSPLGGDKYAWRFQMVYGSSLLTGLQAGDVISGLTFRLDVTSPDGDGTGGNNTNLPAQTINQYQIKLGTSANAPGSMSDVFADNYIGDITTVRSGQLVINDGDFTGGGTGSTPNPFGKIIDFNLGTFTYTGGPLLIEIAHDGFTGPFIPGQSQPGRFVDDDNQIDGSLAQQLFGLGFNATVGNYGFEDQAMVIQLQFERAGGGGLGPNVDLPEPSGLNLFGAALACMMGVTVAGRRRKLVQARDVR